jgi:hypothetical protein
VSRRAQTLPDSLVSLLLFALLGLPILTTLHTTASTTARAGEHQLATLVAARITDALLSTPPPTLARLSPGGPVDLASLAATRTLRFGSSTPLTVDGLAFTAHVALSSPAPGLLRATISVEWPHIGHAGRARVPFRVTRLIADPHHSLEPR